MVTANQELIDRARAGLLTKNGFALLGILILVLFVGIMSKVPTPARVHGAPGSYAENSASQKPHSPTGHIISQ